MGCKKCTDAELPKKKLPMTLSYPFTACLVVGNSKQGMGVY